MNSSVNRHEWRVIGMSRSGNHAIINWLLDQAEGRICFLNCTEPKNNPFCWPRPMGSGETHWVNYPDFDFDKERRGQFSQKDYLVYSFEDCFLGMIQHPIAEAQHDTWVGTSESRQDILILRDAYNLFASRLAAGIGWVSCATAMRIWKQHAREFLEPRRLRKPPVLISYNQWVRSQAYRREIADRLQIPFSDALVNRVPDTAGGSSFDGMKCQKQASRMKVFERWRKYVDCDEYRRLFDAEVVELSRAIFGPMPAAERCLLHRSTAA